MIHTMWQYTGGDDPLKPWRFIHSWYLMAMFVFYIGMVLVPRSLPYTSRIVWITLSLAAAVMSFWGAISWKMTYKGLMTCVFVGWAQVAGYLLPLLFNSVVNPTDVGQAVVLAGFVLMFVGVAGAHLSQVPVILARLALKRELEGDPDDSGAY